MLNHTQYLPPNGNKNLLKVKGCYPEKGAKVILRMLSRIERSPKYEGNKRNVIVELRIIGDRTIHRSFARAFGRSSSKERHKLTIHIKSRQIEKVTPKKSLVQNIEESKVDNQNKEEKANVQ